MALIHGVRIDDRFIELIPDSPALNSFFKVDSLNLLLGKNGSGKTELLLAIADAITSTNSSTELYVSKDNELKLHKSNSEHNFHAIYYSALPYRRKLKKRSRYTDASPNRRKVDENDRLIQLQNVAKSLNINTTITGYVGYSSALFRTILIPCLLRETGSIENSELKYALDGYEKLNHRTFNVDELGKLDSQREELIELITKKIEDHLHYFYPDFERILHLSAIEFLTKRGSRTDLDLAESFFCDTGIFTGRADHQTLQAIDDVVGATKMITTAFTDTNTFSITDNSLYFHIENITDADLIRSHNTSIKIHWDKLSSGLQALAEQFTLISDSINKIHSPQNANVVLLIDEGDAYLHLDWQRKYIALLNDFLGKIKRDYGLRSLQVILASHSPLIAADLPAPFVTNLDFHSIGKTFAAPIDDIIRWSFDSNVIGEFAANKINEIYSRAKKLPLNDIDFATINEIGDEAIKTALIRAITNDNKRS
jgi:predicted ATP-dependent endonuclease of OLD family